MKALYTGGQWSLIDLANQYGNGLDKELFDTRLGWARELVPTLTKCNGLFDIADKFQSYIDKAKEPELFAASLINVWDIIKGNPTGYFIELDAASSGCQLMSVATRCITGMKNTGAIGDETPFLYKTIVTIMNKLIPFGSVTTPIALVKKATVPYMYGSDAMPKKIFDEAVVPVFREAYKQAVPRAQLVKEIAINIWDSKATEYEIEYPDGHTALIRVIVQDKTVYSFNGRPLTYIYKKIGPIQKGEEGTKALAARIIHGLDGYTLRETNGRCDHSPAQLKGAIIAINRYLDGAVQIATDVKLRRLEKLSARFEMVSIVGAASVRDGILHGIDKGYLTKLRDLCIEVLENETNKLKLIHDGFGSLPCHVNTLKTNYNNVLASIYEGVWLFKTLESISGKSFKHLIDPVDPKITEQIRNNIYAIS